MISGIITGILAGYITRKHRRGTGCGCLVYLFLGIISGVVGGWIFSLFGLSTHNWIGEIIMAVIGATVILWLFAKLK